MADQFQFHSCQDEISSCQSRFRVVNCGRRFGKTVLATYEMISKAMFLKDARVAYIAPTYGQARDICWKELKKLVRPIAKKINESRMEITISNQVKDESGKCGESFIVLRGWESVETLRGQHFHFVVLDEVASMSDFWTGWREVVIPTLTDDNGHVLFLSTPKGFNHFYDLFNMEHKNSDYKSFKFSTYDNPFIPREAIESLRLSTPDDTFAQEYLAEFKKTQGLVYPEFSREKHLLTPDELDKLDKIEWAEVMCGVDFGYTNPSAIIVVKRTTDNVFYITEEWYKTKQTTEQIAEKVKQLNPYTVYPDPAEPDRVQILMNAQLNCREVNKDIAAGIDRVRELFKQNRIKIHPLCQSLILELETYHYPDHVFGRNDNEKPVKENDHLCDALRYVLYSNNLDPIDFNIAEKFKLYTTTYE